MFDYAVVQEIMNEADSREQLRQMREVLLKMREAERLAHEAHRQAMADYSAARVEFALRLIEQKHGAEFTKKPSAARTRAISAMTHLLGGGSIESVAAIESSPLEEWEA